MSEAKFEKALIEKLTSTKGWVYREDLSNRTVDVLEENWRNILNENNWTKLAGVPLTDNEFEHLKLELNHNKTPYDAQLLLAGAGGVGTLPLVRDDGTQLEIEIFYEDEIAGGRSRYEVVNQITFPNLTNSLAKNRRTDIVLLINGLPVAQAELKDESRDNAFAAFEQFRKYDMDGMYTGLFSFVQVMFILSQHSAHYFARPKNTDEYNKSFVFGWRDEQGQDVTDAMVFAHEVMGIPALHRLVTTNMIPDADNDNLMVMRSYQIQATRAIMDRMRVMENNGVVEKEGGYVWHTTGSGKTVTSFKVAQLLASMPRVRNVLFIVDRVDLVNQTADNFKSFAYKTFEKRIQVVRGHELKSALKKKNKSSNIYLITVQGLDKAIKAGLQSDERMVILMDEAHRSASGDAVDRIKKAMPKTTWFGFTGTPNFYSDVENGVKTSHNKTTADVFGERLHQYTIKDAIGDQNVLGFDVSYYTSNFEKNAEAKHLTDKEFEKEVYNSRPYMELVVKDIRDNWRKNHSGPVEMGIRKPNQFHGIFAVSGKKAVVAYYKLFKELAPELRVAITYSRDETNEEGSSGLQEELKQAMREYSTFYDTRNFLNDKDSERFYLNDLTKRIAHKKPYNQKLSPEQEEKTPQRLDLIIVSDQLLTGFDSKYVNTIYMDKVLKEGLLIQAMSRTNRTIDQNAKPYGKVRFYRNGTLMKKLVEEALVIYTQGGKEKGRVVPGPFAPDIAEEIKKLIPKIEILKALAGDDFSQIPDLMKEKIEFVHIAEKVNRKVQRLVQQGYEIGDTVPVLDDNQDPTGEEIAINLTGTDHFSSLQARLYDTIKLIPQKERPDLTDLDIAMGLYKHVIIDYDRLVELLNEYMATHKQETRQEIEKHINALDGDNKAELEEIINGIEQGKYTEPFDTESLEMVRQNIRSLNQELAIRRWGDGWGIPGNTLLACYEDYLPGVGLNDNPKLKQRMNEIETAQQMSFFKISDFEESLLAFFKTLQ